MEYFAAGFADGREIANADGQTADDYFYLENMMHGQNNENSNATMAQLETPVPQAPLVANASMPNQDKAAKKRESDKAYRQRVKQRKTEMEGNLKGLTQENKALKDEVRALKDEVGALSAENTSLNQAFQSRGEEMVKLKHELNESRHELEKQNGLLQTISDILVASDLSLKDEEIKKLKNENDMLRQIVCMDNPMSQLVEKIGKLEHDGKIMKLQLDALCDKLIRAKIG